MGPHCIYRTVTTDVLKMQSSQESQQQMQAGRSANTHSSFSTQLLRKRSDAATSSVAAAESAALRQLPLEIARDHVAARRRLSVNATASAALGNSNKTTPATPAVEQSPAPRRRRDSTAVPVPLSRYCVDGQDASLFTPEVEQNLEERRAEVMSTLKGGDASLSTVAKNSATRRMLIDQVSKLDKASATTSALMSEKIEEIRARLAHLKNMQRHAGDETEAQCEHAESAADDDSEAHTQTRTMRSVSLGSTRGPSFAGSPMAQRRQRAFSDAGRQADDSRRSPEGYCHDPLTVSNSSEYASGGVPLGGHGHVRFRDDMSPSPSTDSERGYLPAVGSPLPPQRGILRTEHSSFPLSPMTIRKSTSEGGRRKSPTTSPTMSANSAVVSTHTSVYSEAQSPLFIRKPCHGLEMQWAAPWMAAGTPCPEQGATCTTTPQLTDRGCTTTPSNSSCDQPFDWPSQYQPAHSSSGVPNVSPSLPIAADKSLSPEGDCDGDAHRKPLLALRARMFRRASTDEAPRNTAAFTLEGRCGEIRESTETI
eukprot:Opistho-2@42585